MEIFKNELEQEHQKEKKTREPLPFKYKNISAFIGRWPGLAAIDNAIIGQNRLPTNNKGKIIDYF